MTVLRQRMIDDMQVRNLSPHTQASCLQQVSLFARYFSTSPDALNPEQIRTYQIYLTNEKKLAPASIHTAVAALRFLYQTTLKREWTLEEDIPFPKKPQKLPVILSPDEVLHFLGCVERGKHRVILTTCYAAGLRISEAVRLKVVAIDSATARERPTNANTDPSDNGGEFGAKTSSIAICRGLLSLRDGIERLPRHRRLRQGWNFESAGLPGNGGGREIDLSPSAWEEA